MKKDDLFLVIDMQNVYKKGGKWECLNTEKAASNVNRIIDFPGFNGNALFTRFIMHFSQKKLCTFHKILKLINKISNNFR